MYTQEDAYQATLNYFNGDELACSVWLGKYALRNDKGELLEKTPTDMHWRMAREFARIETKYPNPMGLEEIFSYMDTWELVPQGSPMSALGNGQQIQSLSNCFVIPSPVDSYGGIMLSDQQMVQIMKRRGGVGLDISPIRPKSMRTSNAAGSTDGIGVFMERYSNSCREVAQGGRRGALMISLSCLHPDIETFINIKQDKTKVTGANVSVRMTNEFMRAVENDSEITLRWPVEASVDQAKFTKVVKAKTIWKQFIQANWNSAEPGLMFWDTILDNSMADIFASAGFKTISSNPCSELVLSALDSCRLLLVNLSKFVLSPFTSEAAFDFERFDKVARKGQRLMDDLVDLEIEAVDRILAKIESDPEPEAVKSVEKDLWLRVRKAAEDGRRTGLGVTALGDAIAMCGDRYSSDESIALTEAIYKQLAVSAHAESVTMAEERGAFPACSAVSYQWNLKEGHPFVKKLFANSTPDVNGKFMSLGRRNIALTTTAPAGSVSILTQTTSGCEPVFMLSYKRRKKINPNDTSAKVDFVDGVGDKWTEFTVYHHGLKKWMEVTGKTDITESPYHLATSADQYWTEHAISNT
jgi:ribonucleoside-diphosphate reductase alpha chain